MKLGRKLRELRLAQNLSQGDIQEPTGLLRAYTSRVENEHVTPSVATLEKYVAALDVPFYSLFYDDPRRAELDQRLENKKRRHGAAKNQVDEYRLFVKIVAGLNDTERAFYKYVADKFASRITGKPEVMPPGLVPRNALVFIDPIPLAWFVGWSQWVNATLSSNPSCIENKS
jgi:transcriptional regulator with XRE-family HTH domain